MALVEKRRLALTLRNEGKSYSQIKKELGISKSTLSGWLRNYPLSREQIRLLRDFNEVRIEKFRQTMMLKKQNRLDRYYKNQAKTWLPLSKRELYLAGLFLYWGEGSKSENHTISINNTDPKVVKFALEWMKRSLKIPKGKIRVFIHLYNDMNIKDEIDYWSKVLNMPKESFCKPYIKKSSKKDIDQKGFGHGTCGVRANNTIIKENILMAIKLLADNHTIIS